ncbi:hypothetical protein DXG01_002934 [Tephrocybe rancida]|nr:hypothetical protein DXG01_002934 [Tephrocybe rancida]
MAAQMAGVFYGSNATECLLSDAKLPLEKLIDLMTTAITAIKAGSSFDASVFVPQLWPELFAASNMRKVTMTDGTGVPTNEEKSYKKGTAKYEAIPIIETGEGTVGPSITIVTTLDAKRNCEAYALQHGKAVPIESDHESDPENNHVSVVEQNERPIA